MVDAGEVQKETKLEKRKLLHAMEGISPHSLMAHSIFNQQQTCLNAPR